MTREELQSMIDSFQKKVTTKDWEIDRNIRMASQAKDANKSLSKNKESRKFATKALKDNASKGGDVAGNLNKESGHISNLGKEWGRTNMIEHVNKVVICEHCGESCNIGNIKRWHENGKCLEKKKLEELILQYHKEGLSYKAIGKIVNKSTATISNTIKKHKLYRPS